MDVGPKEQSDNDREARLCALADKLLFTIEKNGERYALLRTADVSEPVRHDDLTISQAEDILSAWKLRGLGGG